jgi:hypothetical protein
MTVSATIQVMTLSGLKSEDRAVVPTQALARYFGALGVALSFLPSQVLDEDPSHDSAAMAAFCAKHAPPQGSTNAPAILLVASMPPEGDGINGQLMDPTRRGACVVYADSWVFKSFGPEERFEVYVHELGHLLNLLHPEPGEDPKQAMSQFGERNRVTNRAQLWSNVVANAGPSYRSKLRAFFGTGTGAPIGLPMSRACCDLLEGRDASEVAPWGDPFDDDSRGVSDDVAFDRLGCTLKLETDRLQVAQPLDFTVSLRLRRGEKAGDIPAALDLRSGNVRIELAGPDGEMRRLLPDAYACGSLRRRLRPGQVARRHYSVLGDRIGLALPRPGEYRLRAVLPALEAQSAWATISVQPASTRLAELVMPELLRGGPRGQDEQHRRVIGEILADSGLPASSRAYAAVVGAARQLDVLRAPDGARRARHGQRPCASRVSLRQWARHAREAARARRLWRLVRCQATELRPVHLAARDRRYGAAGVDAGAVRCAGGRAALAAAARDERDHAAVSRGVKDFEGESRRRRSRTAR